MNELHMSEKRAKFRDLVGAVMRRHGSNVGRVADHRRATELRKADCHRHLGEPHQHLLAKRTG